MMLDNTDREILALLREDGRASTAQLGRRLGLSRTTVHSRIERLLARRVITGFTVRMGAEQEREQVQAHVLITVTPRIQARVEAALRKLPEVRKLYAVSGQHDAIAIVVTETVAEMDRVLDQIGLLEGIDRTVSFIVLSTRIDR
jgi:DNA-binding Lrp family transcriptional regulator